MELRMEDAMAYNLVTGTPIFDWDILTFDSRSYLYLTEDALAYNLVTGTPLFDWAILSYLTRAHTHIGSRLY